MTLSRRNRNPARAVPRPPSEAKPPEARRRRPPLLVFGLALAWALAASWIALDGRWEIGRLTDEARVQRAAADDKVRALTRRLVGVASHGMLEQEGLTDRLADIIARQVELETRQAAVAALAERAGAVLPAPANPDPAVPRRGAALSNPAPDAVRGRIAEIAGLPLRGQFARIEGALDGLDAGQVRTLVGLAVAFRRTTEGVRGVLADLKLALAPPAPARPPAKPAAPAGRPDVFATQVAQAEAAFEEAGRWSGLAETVPLIAPIEGSVPTSNFGSRKDPFTGAARMHGGMDFRSAVGTPVRTAGSGRVVVAGPGGGYGNLVEIDHGNGLVTRYAHLSAIGVAVDQPVAAGAVVGQVGSTGRSTGPHLHYETRLAGTPLDPARFIAAGQRLHGRPAQAQEPPSAADEPHPETADD